MADRFSSPPGAEAYKQILAALRTGGPASRAQLARVLGLSKSTVSLAADRLLAQGLAAELAQSAPAQGSGRPGRLLAFDPKAACVVGLDIGGTKILAVVCDLAGEVLYQKKVPTTNRLDELAALVHQCLAEAGFSPDKLAALGAGVPGAVDDTGTVLRCRVLQWSAYPLCRLLAQQFACPVAVANDVNAIALGEMWQGAGKGARDLLYLAFGTSVGGAVIANGQLVLGHSFRAGEVGYQLGRWDLERGHVNRLGQEGVFESKTSGTALGRLGRPASQLFADYAAGLPDAVVPMREFITETAVVIANGLSFLDPEIVILGGGVAGSMAGVLPQITELVEELTPIRSQICLSALGDPAGALGAARLALQKAGLF